MVSRPSYVGRKLKFPGVLQKGLSLPLLSLSLSFSLSLSLSLTEKPAWYLPYKYTRGEATNVCPDIHNALQIHCTGGKQTYVTSLLHK